MAVGQGPRYAWLFTSQKWPCTSQPVWGLFWHYLGYWSTTPQLYGGNMWEGLTNSQLPPPTKLLVDGWRLDECTPAALKIECSLSNRTRFYDSGRTASGRTASGRTANGCPPKRCQPSTTIQPSANTKDFIFFIPGRSTVCPPQEKRPDMTWLMIVNCITV